MTTTITASFITGFPDETESDLRATLDMVGDLLGIADGKVIVQLHLLAPEPGSELGKNADQLLRYDGIAPDLEPVTREHLVKSHPRIFASFHYLDTRLGRRLHVLSSLFVMQVLPTIGYPFTAWIVREIAAGSLAAFFFEISNDIPEPTPDSLERIRDAMVACCYRHAARHVDRDALISDYARLRQAVVFMSHRGEPAANGKAGQEVIQDHSLSLTVSHDVVAFARALEQGADPRKSDWHSGQTLQVRVTRSGGSVSATSTIIG